MNFLFGKSGDDLARKGIEAANAGNYRQALDMIEKALKRGVKKYKKEELFAIMGRAYNEIGEHENAITACDEAIKLKPNYPAAWNNKAIAYWNMHRVEEAEAIYRHTITLDPNYGFAYASLGALYSHTGRAEEARNVLEKAIQVNPSLYVAHGNLALAYAMLGDFDKANASLKQAIALGYANWKDVSERIQALAAAPALVSQSSASASELEPAAGFPCTRQPVSAHGIKLTRDADELLSAGKRREAINLYRQVLSIEPNCSYVLVQLGLALQEEGRVAEAIKTYTLALKIDPEFGYAYYARGWGRHYLRDYAGELADAQRGFRLDEQNPGPYLRRIGAAFHGLGKYLEALDAYNQAIGLYPDDEGTIYNRGMCYYEFGNYVQALVDLTRALELDPGWDWALIGRAKVYIKLGDLHQARKDIASVLQSQPNHPQALELQKML